MRGKILLVTGLAVGYVLGTRAGRERYEEIKAAANKLWNDPRVQKPVHQAQDFVKDKAPEAAQFVSDGVSSVVDKVTNKPTPAKKPASKPAAKSAASSTNSTSSSK